MPGAQLGNGQFGGGQFGGGQIDPPQKKPVQGMELINDLHLRKAPGQDVGRFQIVKLEQKVLLLDSRTGDTWVLTADEKQSGKLSWVGVPRMPAQAEDAAEPKQKFEGDPFE